MRAYQNILLVTALATVGCRPPDVSTPKIDDPAALGTGTKPFYVALGNAASATEPDAYKVYITASSPVDDASVQLCFGQLQQCLASIGATGAATPLATSSQLGTSGTLPTAGAPTPTVMRAVATEVTGGKVYASEKYVLLTSGLPITILGKANGQDVTHTVTIVPKGAGVDTSASGTLPDPSLSTGGLSPGLDPSQSGGINQTLNTDLSNGLNTGVSNGITPGIDPLTGLSQTGVNGIGQGTIGGCLEAPSQDVCQAEAEIARIVNEQRQQNGLGALVLDQKISWVSRAWSTEQARTGQISHNWFESGQLAQVYQQKFSQQSPIMAENVAMNSCDGGNPTGIAQAFMTQWMNSPGHRENILRQGMRTIGVGVAKSSSGCYATQDFGQ